MVVIISIVVIIIIKFLIILITITTAIHHIIIITLFFLHCSLGCGLPLEMHSTTAVSPTDTDLSSMGFTNLGRGGTYYYFKNK